ncbi:Enoyl-(acyl-carrier-protein) reductase [NADPH] [Candidatus Hydrogenisulfobacillus filiaventi]|uniref:Enoyl-(Acyl-carrier-protein) reductase [NADPH] n=1 Tax=Candidatus Hydrogenisulfobacillus filiaventi TaxID=2707344 RepID=A0A6F8ZKA2_9FIRM|nr:SDR family oxidoreductase [Bacillota bacterium]CAB1130096.1 Enoyl-(acyl-carrier-protein) reductase [NADPH] [Candidatus Hydrogenisulfobacillus filiaventi]
MAGSWEGKVVVVTGGTRGIGLAIARAFVEEGARVALTFRRHRQAAREAVEAFRRAGALVRAEAVDAGDPEAMAAFVAAVAQDWGGVDAAVHNAASGVARPLSVATLRHWTYTLGANAFGLVALAQACAPWWRRPAALVAVSSLGGIRAYPDYGLVGASKGALESLARHLARELGPAGVRVNVVSAGPVDTEALSHYPARDTMLEDFVTRSALHRPLQPADVAAAVRFLAGPDAAMITGHTLVVDGGYSVMG